METVQRKFPIRKVHDDNRGLPYVNVRVSACLFMRNVALSTGGNQSTFGGGFAASNGPYVVEGSVFAYNTATEGDSVAALGESMYYACNDNDPPLVWARGPDCSVKVCMYASMYVCMYV
jgi:hypothetical protein